MEDWVYCIIFWDLPVVYLQKPLFYHCIDTQMEPALNPTTFASWTQIKDFHSSLSKRWTIFCPTQTALLYPDQSLSRNDGSHNTRSWPLTSQNISLFWLWVYVYFSCCDKQFWKQSAVPLLYVTWKLQCFLSCIPGLEQWSELLFPEEPLIKLWKEKNGAN